MRPDAIELCELPGESGLSHGSDDHTLSNDVIRVETKIAQEAI